MRGYRLGFGLMVTALVVPPLHAADGDMSVATFLEKADKLKKKGAFALLSSDMKVLKREATASGAAYRAKLKADKEAGRTPHSCPPEKGALNSDELLAHYQSYPASQRSRVTVRQGFFDLMKKRYPCE